MPAAGQKAAETSQPAPEATAEERDREIAELREAVRQLQESPGTRPAAKPAGVATPRGSNYEALTNLSIPRVTAPGEDKAADVVHRGDTVFLTDEQAARFNDRRRHRVPVIRPAKEQNDPAPDVKARDLFGSRPKAQQFGARPDPAGSTTVRVIEDADPNAPDPADPRNAPEGKDPGLDLSVDPDAHKGK
jgi:hypothetical protein